MKTFEEVAAQGDMIMIKISELPDDAQKQKAEKGEYIITHSETGHNHVIKERDGVSFYSHANDNLRAYLVVDNKDADLIHKRSNHTHETIKISPGVYAICRQRQEDIYGEIRAVVD